MTCDICSWKNTKTTLIWLLIINIFIYLVFKSRFSVVTIASYMYLFYLAVGTAVCAKGKDKVPR